MKRFVPLLTVLALLCTLCGCHVTPNPTPAGEKTAFTRHFVSAPLEDAFTRYFTRLSTGDTYTAYYEYRNATDDTQTAVLSQFDYTNKTERTLYQTTFTLGIGAMPINVSYGGDTVWIIQYTEGDLMYGGTTPSGNTLQAVNVTDGTVLREWNLSDIFGKSYDFLLHAIENDTAYVLIEHEENGGRRFSVARFNAAAGTISDWCLIEALTALPELIALGDGRAAVLDTQTETLYPIAKDTMSLEAPLTLVENLPDGRFFSGGDNENFLYLAGQTLYGTEGNLLVDFSQWGVNFTDDALRDITLTDGVYRVLLYEDSAFGVYTLTPCTAAEAAPTLRIAGYAVGDGIHAAASAFNRTRFDYTARVIDYRQYDDNPNALYPDKAGVTKLNTELLAGGDFDVLYLNDYLSSAALARQGGLLDLYPLLDAGDKVTRDTFVPSILEKTETDGHLYSLSTAFGIRTLLSDRRVIGEYPTLSIADWNALEAADPDRDVTDMAEETFMYYLSDIAVHDFIKDGTAQFNTDTFIAYLETMATLPNVDELWEQLLEDLPVADYATIADGTFLLMPLYLRNLSFYQRTLCNLADGAQFTGYPTENGVGHVMEFADTLGIFAATDKKDAAWDFLRLTVTENRLGLSEGGLEQPGFPTDRASFEAQLDHYRDPSNFVDMSGAPATTFEGAPLRALTEEDIDRLYDIIDAAKPLVQADRAIVDILEDEASYFLKGEATAADTAARIGQRVQLYLNEQG